MLMNVFAMQCDARQNTVGTTIITLQSSQPKMLVNSSELFFSAPICAHDEHESVLLLRNRAMFR